MPGGEKRPVDKLLGTGDQGKSRFAEVALLIAFFMGAWLGDEKLEKRL
jgi:hypothetical protein